MNIFETLVYSTVLLLGQQEHYLQGSTRSSSSSSSSSVPLLLLASDHDDDDDDNDNENDNYSEASEASEVSTSIITSIKTMKEQERKRRLLAPPTKYQIRALFHLWKHYLISGDIDGLSKRYTTNAILNPMNSMNLDNNNEEHSSSNTFETFLPLTNSKSIQNYYNEFISLYRPTDCRILRSRVTIREHISSDDDNNNASSYYAQDTGIIEIITFSGQIIPARYTFIYGKCGSSSNNRWKIVNHTFSKIDIDTTTTAIPTSAISGTIKTNNDNKNGSIITSPARSTPPQSSSSSSSSSSPSPPIMSVFQSSLPSMTKVTTKATYTPPPSTIISRRRPSQIDYLVKILTRSQSITQNDLILFSTTSTTTTAGSK